MLWPLFFIMSFKTSHSVKNPSFQHSPDIWLLVCSLCRLPPVLFLENCKAVRTAYWPRRSWLDLDYMFPMCFGQRRTERVNAKSDITVLGEASSQDTLKQANHWVLYREFFYYLNPKCHFACCVLARSNIHTVCWTSKCGYVKSTSVLSYSSISCWSSQLKKKKKKSGFYSSLSSANMLTIIISYCKNSWKICHPNIITLFYKVLDQKLACALYKSRVRKGNSSISLKCYLYCQLSFHKCVFKSEI